MSHVYQPIMVREILRRGGRASREEIARAFLAEDRSQIEYYEEITGRMPGPVLSRHGICERDGKGYRLADRLINITEEERAELIDLCSQKLNDYIEKRGLAPWQHRRKSASYLPGSLRYEIIKRAAGKCEACGISVNERAIEVDHILPRNHGGTDDPANLQALCYKCNAEKRDRDDTDFAKIKRSYDDRAVGCPFCEVDPARISGENELAFVIRDGYPVTDLHTLLIKKRHVANFFDLHSPERNALLRLLDTQKEELRRKDERIEGFNIGVNVGEMAGQTISHAHIHLIPRRRGDVKNPMGGVRGVIPAKQHY